MCEFYGSNGNGFGDIWWTDNPIYFSSIDGSLYELLPSPIFEALRKSGFIRLMTHDVVFSLLDGYQS